MGANCGSREKKEKNIFQVVNKLKLKNNFTYFLLIK